MKISEFPRAMRQILGKGNKYYVSKNNFNQLEEVSKVPLIEDQESRTMAKDGYPDLDTEGKITDYIEPNIKAQTGSSTPVPGVNIDQESYEYILKLKLPLDEKLKLIAEFGGNKSRTEVDDSELASRYGVEKGADIYKGGSSNKKFGAEYTNDGLTIGGRYDPDSDDTNFYISKKFQDGGVVEREDLE